MRAKCGGVRSTVDCGSLLPLWDTQPAAGMALNAQPEETGAEHFPCRQQALTFTYICRTIE